MQPHTIQYSIPNLQISIKFNSQIYRHFLQSQIYRCNLLKIMEVYLIPKMKTLQFKYHKLSFLPSSHCQSKKLQFKYLIFLPGKSLCSHGWRRRDLKMQSSERLSDWRVKEDTQESRCEIVKMKERRRATARVRTGDGERETSRVDERATGDWRLKEDRVDRRRRDLKMQRRDRGMATDD